MADDDDVLARIAQADAIARQMVPLLTPLLMDETRPRGDRAATAVLALSVLAAGVVMGLPRDDRDATIDHFATVVRRQIARFLLAGQT